MSASSLDTGPVDPWTVDTHSFPENASPRQQLVALLNYAVLAPSSHNTQPWRFVVTDDTVRLYADRSRALPVVDPDDRSLVISCAAALFHLRVAMRHAGVAPIVATGPSADDPDRLASVRWGGAHEVSELDAALFHAIQRRSTHRGPFHDRPVPEAELRLLRRAAHEEGAHLHVFSRPDDKEQLADWIAEGTERQAADPAFRAELADWIRLPQGGHTDGMPGSAFQMGPVASYLGPTLIRHVDWGSQQSAADRRRALDAPVLMVLSTSGNEPVHWLQAGQAIDRVLLMGTLFGLQASFLNPPVEVAPLRDELAACLGRRRAPQVVVRLGDADPASHTPRRPVRDVLDLDSIPG